MIARGRVGAGGWDCVQEGRRARFGVMEMSCALVMEEVTGLHTFAKTH